MNEITIKEIEEIHEYLLNKDNMRLGQRIKTNFHQIERQLNNIEEKLNKVDKSTEITIGQFLIYLGFIIGIFGGLLIWILLT